MAALARVPRPLRPLVLAGMLGVAGGCRTFTPAAAIVLAGRGPRGWAGRALVLAAVGELGFDKLPQASSRLRAEALGARGVSAGLSGAALAGPAGGGVAAVAALAAAFGAHRARRSLAAARPQRRLVWAALEDAAAIVLAAAAVRRAPRAS